LVNKIDTEELERLKKDVNSLKFRFPIKTIADRMGVDRGNLSAYLSGKKPVSERFIRRFYHTFAEDLKAVADLKRADSSSVEEEIFTYGTIKAESQSHEIEQLKIMNDTLTRNVQILIESNRKLVDSNQKLVEANVLLINKKIDKA
jgi:transcriptional regulator with XRE-family HTH domain